MFGARAPVRETEKINLILFLRSTSLCFLFIRLFSKFDRWFDFDWLFGFPFRLDWMIMENSVKFLVLISSILVRDGCYARRLIDLGGMIHWFRFCVLNELQKPRVSGARRFMTDCCLKANKWAVFIDDAIIFNSLRTAREIYIKLRRSYFVNERLISRLHENERTTQKLLQLIMCLGAK